MKKYLAILIHFIILCMLVPASLYAMYTITAYSFEYFNLQQLPELFNQLQGAGQEEEKINNLNNFEEDLK